MAIIIEIDYIWIKVQMSQEIFNISFVNIGDGILLYI